VGETGLNEDFLDRRKTNRVVNGNMTELRAYHEEKKAQAEKKSLPTP